MDTEFYRLNRSHQKIGKYIFRVLLNIFLWSSISVYSSIFQDSITLDSSIRHGKLSNGLSYYIKPIKDGTSEMEVRLLIKAGSALVDQDQYDLQHVLEHVAFKGGKNMTMAKANSLGFELGEISGNTSYDFTQYNFTSIESTKKLDIAFQLFQDIIWGLDLRDEYIDSERSVIINEISNRGRFSGSSLMNSLESSMIGRKPEQPTDIIEYINSFPPGPLIRYYEDWYRPDLMAIVAIGDIENVDDIENRIIKRFSKGKWVRDPRPPVKDYKNYRNLPPQFIMKENPYLPMDSKDRAVYLRLYMRQKKVKLENELESLRNEQKRELLLKMLRGRFMENQKSYVSGYNVIPEFLLPSSLGLALHVTIEEGSEKQILLKTVRILKQLQMYGFNKEEFVASKKMYLRSLSNRDVKRVSYWVDGIRDHFVYGEVLPSNKKMLLKGMMADLTLAEMNQFMDEYIKIREEEMDIIVLSPPDHRVLSYSEKTIRGWISEVESLPVRPYHKPNIAVELIDREKIGNLNESSFEKKFPSIPETSEYLLGNGIRVVLNPIDSILIKDPKQLNRISFHGFSPIGIDCYPLTDYFSAMNSTNIIINSGIGSLDKFELQRYITNKGFDGSVAPYIEYKEVGIRGSASIKDLELALQLVYLYFTKPIKNSMAFEDWKLQATSRHALSDINYDDFLTTIKSKLGDRTFLPRGSMAMEGTKHTDIDRAFEIYQELFGNTDAFTFVFSGNFPKDNLLLLCRKYLGNLPIGENQIKCGALDSQKHKAFSKPHTVTMPATAYTPEVQVQLVYSTELHGNNNWKEEIKLQLMQRLMNFSMMQKMRFNSMDGGVYNIGVGYNIETFRSNKEIIIRFSCSPDNEERLVKEVKQIVESFKIDLVDIDLFEEEIRNMTYNREAAESSRANNLNKIYRYYRFGTPWISLEQELIYINSLSIEDIRKTAQKYLLGKPFEFKMLPFKSVK